MKARQSQLFILGAGGFGAELLWIAQSIPRAARPWELAGFLDDEPERAAATLQQCGITLPVRGRIVDYHPVPGDCFVCAIGHPATKLRVCELICARGGEFVNLIHPSAQIAPGATIGLGLVMSLHSLISVQARVGNFVTLNCMATVGHDTKIGDGCTLSSHCDITAYARLERGVFLGSHACILPNVQIGAGSTVGAGSVATTAVRPGTTVFGVPARVLGGARHSKPRVLRV